MRYRPFGRTGSAVSNLTLSLGFDVLARGPEAARDLIYSALEAGVNSYLLESADPILAEVTGQALSNLDRKLVCVSLMLGRGEGRRGPERDFSAEGLSAAIDRVLHVSGLGWIDLALLDEPADDELPQAALTALKTLRSTGLVRLLGVSGDGPVMDAYVSTGAFDVLATPFHVNSAWPVRSRIRTAREQDMAVFGYDYFPAQLNADRRAAPVRAVRRGLFGFGAKTGADDTVPAKANTFAFLHHTSNWSAEAVCLAYALTEPAISSILVRPRTAEALNELALTPERDLPPGLAAQIEMARVATATAA